MKSERTQRRALELVIALAIGVAFCVLVATFTGNWFDRLKRESLAKLPSGAPEQRVEIVFERPEVLDIESSETAVEIDDDETNRRDPVAEFVQSESPPESSPRQAPELVPETPIEVLEEASVQRVEVEPMDNRAAVDQPTTNDMVPDSDEFYWAEVDNRAEVDTRAEEAVEQLDDVETVDETVNDANDASTPDSGDGAQNDHVVQAGEEAPEDEGADERTDDVRGGDAQSVAAASTEGGPSSEAVEQPEQNAADGGDSPEVYEGGTLDSGEPGSEGTEQQSASERMARVFERAAGAGAQGAGTSSVTRDGAVAAHASFDQLFGERTATGRERSRAQRRREGVSGDHQHEWERTREALENHDILVATGEETHLNTRRSAHAAFINQYHNRIHQRWRSFTNSLGTGGSGNRAANDMTLKTVVDIRIMADGEVERVRIRRTSGSTYFDAEAVRVHMSVGLAPSPPDTIVCGDGAVYIRWIMSRNIEGCGTFNATLHCPG